MKTLSLILSLIFCLFTASADTSEERKTVFDGAWEVVTMNGAELGHRGVFMVEAPYAFYTEFDEGGEKFCRKFRGKY